jgi:hypothetical protein
MRHDPEMVAWMNVPEEVHVIRGQIQRLNDSVEQIKVDVGKLVTRHEFTPVKAIVYGLCACILTGVVAAMLARVIAQ